MTITNHTHTWICIFWMQSRCAVMGKGRCVVPCVSGHKCLPRRSGWRSFSPLGAGKQPWRGFSPGGLLRAPLCWENQEFLWLRSKVLAEAARFLVPPAVTAGLSHHQRFFNTLLRFKVSKPALSVFPQGSKVPAWCFPFICLLPKDLCPSTACVSPDGSLPSG